VTARIYHLPTAAPTPVVQGLGSAADPGDACWQIHAFARAGNAHALTQIGAWIEAALVGARIAAATGAAADERTAWAVSDLLHQATRVLRELRIDEEPEADRERATDVLRQWLLAREHAGRKAVAR
jgi:hypothetical protein